VREDPGMSDDHATTADAPTAGPGQLALAVGTTFLVTVDERRTEERSFTFGPLPEDQARSLAGLLLNRIEPVPGPGPWRCAIAGGSRAVGLTQAS
jgi:hypothetical protein